MARLVKAVALGLIAIGAGYALHGTDGERWLVEHGMTLVRAAEVSADSPRPPRDTTLRDRGSVANERPAMALTVSSGSETDAGPPERLRFAAAPAELRLPAPVAVARPGPSAPPLPPLVVAEAGPARYGAGGKVPTAPVGEDPKQRLARSIQIELARVGCYNGMIDGDWSAETRKAMKAFNDRVNATLPIAQPDYILLTLLQGHAAKACGTLCPPGQAEADNGSCLPRSVLAEARRQSAVPGGATAGIAATALPSTGALARAKGTDPERKASSVKIDNEAELLAERKAAADKAVAEAERARRETEALQRNKAVTEKALAAAEAEKARARALEERQRQQVAELEARAEAERQRIAAAEERKRRQVAETEARAEAERLARLAEAEKARVAAEARRKAEIAALAVREAAAVRAAPETAAAPNPIALPPVAVQAVAPPAPAADGPAPVERVVMPRAIPKPPQARFVGRFMPPPTYRVGRLPPSPAPAARGFAASRPAPTRPSNVQSIFRELVRHSP